jgi:ubiquinone/menaquinone biosynthesis C-methylase UbiE
MSNAGYVLGSAPTELQRLIRQSQILRPVTERLLRQAGVKQGMRVLDVGCGAGDVSFLAAEMVGTFGSIIGIDRAPEAIAMAKERARNYGFQQADFYVSSVEDFSLIEPFDLVIGRYVLIHQPTPAALIRAARRHVRAGGIVAFHEISLHRGYHCLPRNPAWEKMAEWLNIGFRSGAPSWDAAGRLVEHFLEAGLPWPELFAEMPVGGGENSPLYAWMAETVRTLLPQLVKLGAVTEEEVSIDTLEERLRSEAVKARSQVDVATQVCAWVRL